MKRNKIKLEKQSEMERKGNSYKKYKLKEKQTLLDE